MNLSDQELTLYALREAQLILADGDQDTSLNPEKIIQELKALLTRTDLVEAVDRLEATVGLRLS
ncbi:hypothetical protein AB8B02_08690 [Tardiphaga sp. 862_B3_N4_1]|uniref:hypothetical protein n=1 Tax=Tardiphaga sp. 862_B3_N4_1 TaxID=3240764 RepID=UPI003F2304BD